MASNFRISPHRNSENLHLKLTGDFDSRSALELIDVLKKNSSNGIYNIIIHTSCLDNIYPPGREAFHQGLRAHKAHISRLLFTGEKAGQIAPAKETCL